MSATASSGHLRAVPSAPRALLTLLVVAALAHGIQGACPPPAVELNSRVSLSSEDLAENTVAKYTCDPGFIQLGEATRLCTGDDTWTGTPPACVTNVAQGKPSSQSSTARGGPASNGNDGQTSSLHDGNRCTETKNQTSPWWRVDLLRSYPIEMIRVIPRGCCGLQPLQDLEIRVGSSENLQQNRLCAWYPGELPGGQTRDFKCARPLTGRYVFVQMVGIKGVLSLCEVQVFTSQEFAREQCAPDVDLDKLSLYDKVCYEMQLEKGSDYGDARRSCQKNGGDLVHTLPDAAFQYMTGQLERMRDKMSTQLLWIGVRKTGPSTWKWVSGDNVKEPRWGKDQPNSYVGEQNCVVLDGSRDWLWNDFGCGIGYLHWICEYRPQQCGSPDRRENTTIASPERAVDASIRYRCPEGSQVVGDEQRTCRQDGSWSGTAPTCLHVDCGPLEAPDNGQVALLDNRTTFGARAQYHCQEKHALLGAPRRSCGDGGVWSDDTPQCLYAVCPELAPSDGVNMQLSGNGSVGSEALFSCKSGHRMVGAASAKCELGGAWTAPPPLCQLVDCGLPPAPANATYELPAGTLYGASATYSCHQDYIMEGEPLLRCQEDGAWSAAPPVCTLIDCGQPEVPEDIYVTGYDFKVHSAIEYHCNDGFLQIGDPIRVCRRDGTWSGAPPHCQYVDCGRTIPPLRGDVHYVTGETYLGAQLEYTCSRNYRLDGEQVRTCMEDGQWSADPPTCREVRCEPPERPLDMVVSFSGNDAMRQKAKFIQNNEAYKETFRVDSVASYKCKPGHKVVGDKKRRCQPTGGWTGLPPSCEYVDCGPPPQLPNGTVSLAGGVTHLQAIAEYRCGPKYRTVGEERRLCQEDGSWSGILPTCQLVQCPEPRARTPRLKVTSSGLGVGDTAQYSCSLGHKLVGPSSRSCQKSGEWTGAAPKCQVIDCGPLPDVDNARVFLVNDSTAFDALAEINCFPEFERRGPFRRTCTESGRWSLPETVCLAANETAPPITTTGDLTAVEGRTGDDDQSSGITIGWVIAAVVVFLLLVAGAVFANWRKRGGAGDAKSAGAAGGNAHSMKPLSAGRPPISPPIYSEPLDVPPQTRPLPPPPGQEEEIYASMDDSFSEGERTPPPSVYANRDATYANGLQHSPAGDSAVYVNGDDGGAAYNGVNPGTGGAAYANDTGKRGAANGAYERDAPAARVNGLRAGGASPDSGYTAPVSVNGILM